VSGRDTATPPGVWGVGIVGSAPWPVASADIEDETESAVEHLRTLGIGAGGLVLIVSRLAETIHVAPLELAAGRLAARWSSADATAGDAFRTASLIAQLSPDAVIGVNATMVGALDDPRAVFGRVPCVAVTDRSAYDALDAPRWWLRLGPTSAFECAARAGAHYDASRWRVETQDGEVVMWNRAPRLTACDGWPTGLRGTVITDACECGLAAPRVVVAGASEP